MAYTLWDQDQDVPVYPVTAGGDAADGRRVQASDFLYFQFNDVGAKNRLLQVSIKLTGGRCNGYELCSFIFGEDRQYPKSEWMYEGSHEIVVEEEAKGFGYGAESRRERRTDHPRFPVKQGIVTEFRPMWIP